MICLWFWLLYGMTGSERNFEWTIQNEGQESGEQNVSWKQGGIWFFWALFPKIIDLIKANQRYISENVNGDG